MSIIQGSANRASVRGFYPKTLEGSLRLNDDDSAYLSWTPASAGNRKTWTWSGWVKRGNLSTGVEQHILSTYTAATDRCGLLFTNDGYLQLYDRSAGTTNGFATNALYRDPSAWYHIVVKRDSTQATDSDRYALWVNGEQVTSFQASPQYPPQNDDGATNNSIQHNIGLKAWDSHYADLYLAEVHFTDGTAYTADDFGELKNGVWVAKTPDVTYGTNGFYLDFANSADIGNDVSGNNNDWTPNNFTASDVVLDSPTDNFATLNPLATSLVALSDGNLQFTTTGATTQEQPSTFAVNMGNGDKQWYIEYLCLSVASTYYPSFGVSPVTKNFFPSGTQCGDSNGGVAYMANGQKFTGASLSSYGSSFTANDVIGMKIDEATGTVEMLKNNVSQGNLATGLSGLYYITVTPSSTSSSGRINFGQQPFKYDPPT